MTAALAATAVQEPNAHEATKWVAREIERLRALTYDDLVQLEGEADHRFMQTSRGKELILETQIFWDDPREKKNVRVLVDVWDPAPLISVRSIAKGDFIRAEDGSFVNE